MKQHLRHLRHTCSLLLASLLLLGLNAPVLAGSKDSLQPEKSPNDEREYRALVLDNGLKVMLVSSPIADKAAASLDVFSGSNSDPEDYPGLTHFLEHMLFLGTKKYPQAGEYQEYIASHGGSHNAYTAYENTNYYFDIEPTYLEPALDRFAQFFIAPLFTPEYVERERNAVHSEYQSHLRSDSRRSYYIFKEVLNQDHPLAKFSTGSLETLRDKTGEGSLRQALLRHYQENYSADIMSLAIYGRESLDELEAMARKYFSQIPQRNVSRLATDQPLFDQGILPAQLKIKPVRDLRSLSFTFPIPVAHPYYKSKPLSYLGNVLGHEGEGSLLSLLRDKGWVNSLSAGGSMNYQDNATFAITLGLTEEGVNHVDEISSLVFQFIELTRRQGIHEWLFDEQRRMAEIGFRFQEPSSPISYVSSLSRRLQVYPAAEVLTAPYAFEEFDPELIRNYLSFLRPDNLLLTLTSKEVETDRVEPLFGGQYGFASLSDACITGWLKEDINEGLAIAEPNPFLPENLELKPYQGEPGESWQDKPELLVKEDGLRLWFKQDNIFQVPRANFYLYAKTPIFNESLENALLSTLTVNLLSDSLREYAYPARLAGVHYGVSRRGRGFSVQLGGYNDKQQILLEKVLQTLVQADFQPERFDIIKAELIRSWDNADRQTPYRRLFQRTQDLLLIPSWTEQERIEAIRDITLEQVVEFVPRMLTGLSLDVLYHGNVVEQDAHEMLAVVERYLQHSAQAAEAPYGHVVKLPEDSKIVLEEDIEHSDSAIVMYQQGPDDALQTRATISLLATIVRTPFYDTLRTEQQLGYVVNAGTLSPLKTNGLLLYIESPHTHPIELEKRIQDFLREYESTLAQMSEQTFADIKAGLLNSLRQSPQRLSRLSSRYWGDILMEEYDEDATLKLADAVETLSHAQILAYYREHISHPQAGRLVAWSVGEGHREPFVAAEQVREPDVVLRGDYDAFKSQLEVFDFHEGVQPQ